MVQFFHRHNIHYGWVVVGAAAMAAALTASLRYSFGVFIDPLVDEFGWSRGNISLAYALQFVIFAFVSIGVGWLSERYGTRRLLFLGGIMFLITTYLMSSITELWQLYAYYGVLLGFAIGPFYSPLHSSISLWFRRRLGVAIGLVVAFQSLGALFLSPLLRVLLTTIGWTRTFQAVTLGGTALLGAAIALFRNRPADVGAVAYGADAAETPNQKVSAGESPRLVVPTISVREAFATRLFWGLVVAHFLGCVSHSLPLVHVVSIGLDRGLPGLVAATVLGFVSGFSVLSRFGMAVLADIVSGRRALALTLFIQASGILILLWAREAWAFYLFAFIFGIGYGGEMVVFPVINRDYHGQANTAGIYGYQMAGGALGMATGGYMGGFLYDLTGTYTSAIWFAAIMGYIGAFVALAALPRATQRAAMEAARPSY
ncbi:MAG: MFS transporter [Chloroflexi bacterium]|nr:MFS transporter [Chloroflexota bacterium]